MIFLALMVALAPATALAKRGAKKRRNVKRYHLSLRHANTKEKLNNLWVIRTDPKNKNRQWVGKRARKRLTHFLRDWRTGRSKHVPERLLWYLYLIGQRFDAPIEVVSAYRHKERRSSRHKKGRAVDIRIKGVSPRKLWRYCKRFNRVGLGYYPKSGFVHLDVRKKSYYWIDDSGPGEESKYRKNVSQAKRKKKARKRRRARTRRSKKRRVAKTAPGSKAKPKAKSAPKPKAKPKVRSAPKPKANPQVAPAPKSKTEAKAEPPADEDAPSVGPTGATTPKVVAPGRIRAPAVKGVARDRTRAVKRPLVTPVRPTSSVSAPDVEAPTVAPPPGQRIRRATRGASKKTKKKAKTRPRRRAEDGPEATKTDGAAAEKK